ncbi:hypothetical protein KR067_010470, partial [Drosophila pandora]
MKDFGKMFSGRYSAVCVSEDDDNNQQQSTTTTDSSGFQCVGPATTSSAMASMHRNQRRKSLKANRSMYPMGILNGFFMETNQGSQNRVPTHNFCRNIFQKLFGLGEIRVKVNKFLITTVGLVDTFWSPDRIFLYIRILELNTRRLVPQSTGSGFIQKTSIYREIMTHENVIFNENDTMSSTPSHPLVWQQHLSEGRREDDPVVMLNIAMLAISHLTANHPFFVRMALKTLLVSTKSEPIVQTTAKEFMFGYPSALATLGNTFLPNWISFEKVGLIDRMYDFSTDFETFYTGKSNPAESGLYATYRGEASLPQWENEHCSNIEHASDGTKFKSFLLPNETVKFFRKSMCRPIHLYRVGEKKTFGSLSGYSYVFEDNAFDNGVTNDANKCFCRKGYCQPVGLIDVTDCYYGFPISLSFPHFMGGDVGLQKNITGMNPDPAIHSSEFIIQPESGLPLSLSVKVQINMHFQNLNNYQAASKFSHLTVPMLWFEIMMPKLPDFLDSRFNFYLNLLPLVNPLFFWSALLLGVCLLGYAITKATLQMSNYARKTTTISERKFARVNLINNLSGVTPTQALGACEMKFINDRQGVKHKIRRSKNTDLKFQNLHRLSKLALEIEPALSDSEENNDEGRNC